MQKVSPKSGILFAIKRYALHDGPDIRVTIFFKGCPLSCAWCHNPEGITFGTSIISMPGKCIACHECVSACPQQALNSTQQGLTRSTACIRCGECARTCPALAHESIGASWDTPKVMAEIEKEIPFFEDGNGGVTFSGGEPLAQPDFLEALLVRCGELDLHRAVDTSGFAPRETVERIMPHADLFLYDIKHMDDARHKAATGVGNTQILSNARLLAESRARLQLRLPLIPGINDDESNIHETARFARSLPDVTGIDVLPYHDTARSKYRKLQMTYPGDHIPSASPERTNWVKTILESYGLNVRIGG